MPIIPYQTVPKAGWCSQGPDNRFGLCFYAMLGNQNVLRGLPAMPNGEIMNAAREIEGFNDWIAATDKGENLEVGFRYIQANGWPGDPTLTISDWRQIDFGGLGATLAKGTGADSWLLLPQGVEEGTYDFTDAALERRTPGTYAHAVLTVDQLAGGGLVFITWQGEQAVSKAWADAYFQGLYDVTWRDVA